MNPAQLRTHLACTHRLREVVAFTFDIVLVHMLENGEIHLNTEAETRLKDAVVDCVCFRLEHDGSVRPDALPDLPFRAERELRDVMGHLFAPCDCRHPLPRCATARECWNWMTWRVAAWFRGSGESP